MGGQNDDTYIFGPASAAEADQVTENTNEGIDTLNFAALTTGVSLQLGSNAVQPVHANRTLKLNSPSTFENAIGGSGADTLIGNGLNNTLTGNAGNDTLNGSAGNDILNGGQNDDTYIFGTASVAEADQVTENTNEGIDTLNFAALTTSVSLQLGSNAVQPVHTNRTLKLNSPSTFENAIGGSGADTLIGNGLNNTLTGNAGNDTLIGSAGNDILLGGQNDDTYSFGTASAAEADELIELQFEGTDLLNFSSLSDGVIVNLSLGGAVQSVHSGRTLKLNSGVTFENILGGSAKDLLIGNSLNNRFEGGNGSDILLGNDGNDTLYGQDGRDILIGGFGSDRIFGGSDDDIVIGGWRFEDMVMSSSNITEIRNALSVWENINSSYQTRVNTLRQSTSALAVGTKVKADLNTDIDNLNGELGLDWFFAGATDLITLNPGEIVENI
ncbi:MAG: M10 family metallopeptidase C-terminal domain-containing protein [Planctomycetaceae bacterium]